MLVGGSETKVKARAVRTTYLESCVYDGFWEVKMNNGYVKNGPDRIINYGLLSPSGLICLLNSALVGHPKCFSSARFLDQDLTASCGLSLLYTISSFFN